MLAYWKALFFQRLRLRRFNETDSLQTVKVRIWGLKLPEGPLTIWRSVWRVYDTVYKVLRGLGLQGSGLGNAGLQGSKTENSGL